MVYTSSIFSFFTCLNMAAYSVSKRGLEAFADCLRVEMASFGVQVCPPASPPAPGSPGGGARAGLPRLLTAAASFQVSIIQPGNFGRATNILKTIVSCSDIWEKLDEEKQQIFNRHYIRLASKYFASACNSGFQSSSMVTEAMLHAITSSRPKHRYLLVSSTQRPFFQLLPFLPTGLTDGIFSFSHIYAKRRAMLYS